MSTKDEEELGFEKYKAAMDASMMVATAKLFVFNQIWKELEHKPEVGKLNAQDTTMVRRLLREVIAAMDDTLFFFPPDEAGTKNAFTDEVKAKLSGSTREIILAEFGRQLRSQDPTLSKYFQ